MERESPAALIPVHRRIEDEPPAWQAAEPDDASPERDHGPGGRPSVGGATSVIVPMADSVTGARTRLRKAPRWPAREKGENRQPEHAMRRTGQQPQPGGERDGREHDDENERVGAARPPRVERADATGAALTALWSSALMVQSQLLPCAAEPLGSSGCPRSSGCPGGVCARRHSEERDGDENAGTRCEEPLHRFDPS